MEFDFSSILHAWPLLLQGLAVTFWITFVATVAGLGLGLLLAVARLSQQRALRLFSTGYIHLFRSIPLVMVILWFYLIVPQLIAHLTGNQMQDIRLTSAITAFSLFEAAFYAEIIRTGIQSVARGQFDAGRAMGLTHVQLMRLIILPQAFRNMIPPLLTQLIILFRDSALVYVIGLADFFGMAYKIGDRDGRLVELLLFAGMVYFMLCYAASLLVTFLKRRFTP